MAKKHDDDQRPDSQLAEELERLRIVFDSMNDAVFLSPIDDNGVHGNFVDVNETTCRRLGYSREELLGFNARSINPRANEEKIRAFGRQILMNKIARFEAIHQARDGTHIPVGVTAKLVEIAGKKYVLSLVADRREQKALQNEVARFGYLVEHMSDEIYVFTNSDYRLLMINDSALDNLGYTREETANLHFPEIICGLEEGGLQEYLTPLFDGRQRSARFQTEACRKDGSVYPVEVNIQLSHNEVPPVCLANVQDISERLKAEERINWLASHDSMTGLANRSLFLDRLKMAMEQARRQDHLIAVVYLDIDNFKFVNDTLGHQAGDEMIMEMGRRLQKCVRRSDSVARMGGDEFTMLLTNLRNVADVSLVLEKITRQLEKEMVISGQEFSLGASMGVTLFPFDDADELSDILKQADAAMYHAKITGKHRYSFYSRRLAEEEQRRLRLLNSVHKAMEKDEMQVWYQPRVDLETGLIQGAEALIRWQHPEMGMILPDQFVSILENSGHIGKVGLWVFETACRQLQIWQDIHPGMKLSVNLSSRQFDEDDICAGLAAVLQQYTLCPSHIEMEITEGLLLSDEKKAVETLNRIRDLGMRVSLDDFGKGYSSLNYLKQFPIDVIKIDRSFTADLENDRYSGIIIETLLQLARKLELSVTAEGVETSRQREMLMYFGCREGQGYLFGKPMPAEQFGELLVRQIEESANVVPLEKRRNS